MQYLSKEFQNEEALFFLKMLAQILLALQENHYRLHSVFLEIKKIQ
jgi:hypothetical protein